MSTETIFRQLGRVNESYTGIGPGRTREEYLNLFSRISYSTRNEWPYSSPFAGFYDVTNTSTNLILLNQRYKFSHLRGQILPRETSRPSEEDTKTVYENLLESEQELKSKHTHKLLSPRIPIDPYRHFESIISFGQNKYWHNRMCKGSSPTENTVDQSPTETNMTLRTRRPHTASSSSPRRTRSLSTHRRSRSFSATDKKTLEELQADPAFAESLLQYNRYLHEKPQQPKVGLQQFRLKEPSNRRLRQSGIYRNPALTRGQKLYLLEKCHIYDIEDAKARHTNSYLQVLTKRFNADLPAYKLDFLCKPEYRLNDPRDYFSYEKFVKTPRQTARPLNTGYLSSKQLHYPRIPGEHKKPQSASFRSNSYLEKKDSLKSMLTNPKQSQESTPHASRRRSSSSLRVKNENTVTFRLRQEPKQIPKIPVLSSARSDD